MVVDEERMRSGYSFGPVLSFSFCASVSDWKNIQPIRTTCATYLQAFLYINTFTQPFCSSLDFVRDNLDELVPEGIFCHLLDFLVQNENNRQTHQQSR